METKDVVTTAISIVALLVSSGTAMFTMRQKRYDNERTLRAQITDVVDKLVAVEESLDELRDDTLENGKSKKTRSRRRGRLSDKRSFLVRQAAYLADQIPHLVTDIEYFRIAFAFASSRDIPRAEEYFRRSVDACTDARYRAQTLRGYASVLFLNVSPERGRKVFQQAIDELHADSSDLMRLTKADTYLRWARIEREKGFIGESDRLLVLAQSTYERIGEPQYRQDGMRSLQEFVDEKRSPAPVTRLLPGSSMQEDDVLSPQPTASTRPDEPAVMVTDAAGTPV